MPDLTTEYYYHCETAEYWETTVIGSKGDKYLVKWDEWGHHSGCTYDYSCNCWAYRKGHGKYCKHILQVKDQHCNWNQWMDGGEPVDGKCPKCGGEISIHGVGV